MGIRGFPTLKLAIPSTGTTKSGKPKPPRLEDYRGQRSARAIVEAVVERMPNHVRRVTSADIRGFLAEANGTAKAVFFTEKGTTSPLMKALAADFLGSIQFAQVRSKEKEAVDVFGVTKFPTLILMPGGTKEPLVHDSEMSRKTVLAFLSQVSEPNSGPTSEAKSKSNSNNEKKDKSSSQEQQSREDDKEEEKEESQSSSSRSDSPRVLDPLLTDIEMRDRCLGPKTGACLVALMAMPASTSEAEVLSRDPSIVAVAHLAEITNRYKAMGAALFPVYAVPDAVTAAARLRSKLRLPDRAVVLLVVNAKRGWWARFPGGVDQQAYSVPALDAWLDEVKMGEMKKEKLPDGIILSEQEAKEAYEDLKQRLEEDDRRIMEERERVRGTPGSASGEEEIVHEEL